MHTDTHLSDIDAHLLCESFSWIKQKTNQKKAKVIILICFEEIYTHIHTYKTYKAEHKLKFLMMTQSF